MQEWRRFWAAIGKPVSSRATTSRGHLLHLLDEHTNETDIKDAAWELGVDYDSLPARGKHGKSRELAKLMKREARGYQLINWLQTRFPQIEWPSLDTGPLG